MAILGLTSTESLNTGTAQGSQYRATNIRRKVFYQYPNGAAPLIGLLSLMEEEVTNDRVFSFWEKRLKEQITSTASQGGAKGPFLDASSADLGDGQTMTAPNDTGQTATKYRVKVVDTTMFRKGHVIKIPINSNSAASKKEINGIVTSIVSATILEFYVLETITLIDNGTGTDYVGGNLGENVSTEVKVIGSAFHEGTVDLTSEIYYLPVNPTNNTQLFRTPFSFTSDEMVMPVKFDDEGVYKDKAKSHSLDHMVEVELAILFGVKKKYVPTGTSDPTTGVGLPVYTTGGILWYLVQWEAGSLYENTAATADTDDNKRIIANAAGTMNEATYDTYLERVFRSTSNTGNEKLVLAGSGALMVLNQMYRGLGVLNLNVPSQDTFGMNITAHKTTFGTLYYRSHPLFSRNAGMRKNLLFSDVHAMKYRPLARHDTQLLKNRQPNDALYRKDEWITNMGVELELPENFMFLQNLQSYAP